ncbi:PREDICTED: pentatricopeptide repeat-containing protein At4g16835, mitochondrial [Tarenaya hassleriana]|uniref:pentatricopeptide repeat-containing protein At4g16835, mitochondrial n=1 Tax=Tarenaya hassleriana TaxID=28532 RepID=UPI00053CA81A|nr:PREDICTED: pentatricopeptide repeat-containing protein At4g16835, mitochondrial [Tarenaya hassleriana]
MKTVPFCYEILTPTIRQRFRSLSFLVENADAMSDRSSFFHSRSSPRSSLVLPDGLDSRAAAEVPDQDEITSWNRIIARHIRSGELDSAMKVFHGMRAKNIVTWNSILAGISKVPGRLSEAQKLFEEIPHSDVFSYNTMLSCYVRNSDLQTARSFFDRMPVRDVASWNTMITGYARQGQLEKAREMFSAMPDKNEVTWNAMISGYVECGDLETASSIFRAAPVKGVVAWTAMITGYMRSKKIGLAEAVFRDMPVKKNLVTWNAMISGYVENSWPEDGLKLFRAMLEDGIRPNPSSLSSALLGCSELSALQLGRQVHQLVCKSPLSNDTTASTSLISMYCKCGDLVDAWKLFTGMKRRDIVAWNAMISGYAQHGQAQKALELFGEMRNGGIRPDWITFVAVLLACNHSGLVRAGMEFFDSMVSDYGIQPRPDHYTCMVDLLGRAGKLDEALKLVKSMPFRPHAAIYGTLLGACRVHKNAEMAEFAAKKLLELDPSSAAGYVQLANVYASKNQWQEVARIRKKMKENKVVKIPGYSWIEIENEVHEFRSGDRVHREMGSIEEKLKETEKKMKEKGYVHELEFALHDVGDEQKAQLLMRHSEKLAVAFGCMKVPKELPVRVFKNLRICGDCHKAIKLISEIEGREIIVRDTTRFHHFKDGSCSCGDYW